MKSPSVTSILSSPRPRRAQLSIFTVIEVVVILVIEVIEGCHREGDHTVTVVLPDVLPRAWYQTLLHSQSELAFKLALLRHPGVVVISVPFQLHE